MSKKNYNNFGVPWFCPSNTPPIRPKATPLDLPEHIRNERGRWMRGKIYIIQYIKQNWNKDDRFILTEPLSGDIYKYMQNPADQEVITWSGKFIEIKYSGIIYRVIVELDEGQKRKMGNWFGSSMFYHFAEKE